MLLNALLELLPIYHAPGPKPRSVLRRNGTVTLSPPHDLQSTLPKSTISLQTTPAKHRYRSHSSCGISEKILEPPIAKSHSLTGVPPLVHLQALPAPGTAAASHVAYKIFKMNK